MKRGILIACLIGLVAAVGVRAADQPPVNPPGQQGSTRGGMANLLPPGVLEKLALTADQKTKYDALDTSFKKDVANWRSTQNSGSSSGSTNNVSSDRKGLRQVRKGYVDQLRASLTSDQAATLDKALENLRNGRGNHGGSGPGANPPAPSSGNT